MECLQQLFVLAKITISIANEPANQGVNNGFSTCFAVISFSATVPPLTSCQPVASATSLMIASRDEFFDSGSISVYNQLMI